MTKKILLGFFFGIFAIGALSAQNFDQDGANAGGHGQTPRHTCCGTGHDDQELIVQRLFENRLRTRGIDFERRGGTIWIPVVFHLVALSDGTGRVNEKDVFENLCRMNDHYAPMNVRFFIDGAFDYWNNTVVYNHTNTINAALFMTNRRTLNKVNIFVGNQASPNAQGVTLGYYSPAGDWIFAIRSTVNGGSNTLTHECGHYFSLAHPHFGWDGDTPPANGTQAPAISPSGNVTEKAARTGAGANCASAADGFCDTEPDYNFGLFTASCTFTSNVTDPAGAPVNPDETLFMSYFGDNCSNRFTAQQQAAVLADINVRNYDNFNPPTQNSVTDPVNITSPLAGETVYTYYSVPIYWAPVLNATNYHVEVWRATANGNPITNGMVFSAITNTNSVTVTTLQANTAANANLQYQVRIKAYNAISFCGTYQTRLFETGDWQVGLTGADDIHTAELAPNPSMPGEPVMLTMETPNAQRVTVALFSLSGQTVGAPIQWSVQAGANNMSLDTDGLAAGVYLVQLRSEHGLRNLRLVVQR